MKKEIFVSGPNYVFVEVIEEVINTFKSYEFNSCLEIAKVVYAPEDFATLCSPGQYGRTSEYRPKGSCIVHSG